uniref:Uncharacterized protein n=1 Tax=Trichuris muris TaxID=70415 RepID=A0A5S6QKN0_TRIMR
MTGETWRNISGGLRTISGWMSEKHTFGVAESDSSTHPSGAFTPSSEIKSESKSTAALIEAPASSNQAHGSRRWTAALTGAPASSDQAQGEVTSALGLFAGLKTASLLQ